MAKLTVHGLRSNDSFWQSGVLPVFQSLQSLHRKEMPANINLQQMPGRSVQVTLNMRVLHTADLAIADINMKPLLDTLQHNRIQYSYSSWCLPRYSSSVLGGPFVYPEHYASVQGSALVSNTLFNSSLGPTHLATHSRGVPLGPGDVFFTRPLGGATNDKERLKDTSMHPAWREASQFVGVVKNVRPQSSDGKVDALHEFHNVQMPLLRSIEPTFKASYVNTPDPSEECAPEYYWGANYERLLETKEKWDPDGLFITRLGVGSENWDEGGMCRRRRNVPIKHSQVFPPSQLPMQGDSPSV